MEFGLVGIMVPVVYQVEVESLLVEVGLQPLFLLEVFRLLGSAPLLELGDLG